MRAKLQHVSLTYDGGTSWALNDISLEVREGERLCVLGANGSGKSTLAQVLCGLEAPDAGMVELADTLVFDGQEPNAAAYQAVRQKTGLVFQNPEDQIVTSIVADDVAFAPENLGVSTPEIAARVDEELARVALSSHAQSDPARLSGGQQQRLAIAGALAMHPDMLVLDEPGAMLDVRGRRGVMRVLGELQKSGTTLVHITHFMEEALAADRVIVMNAGSIVAEGSPREIFSHADNLRRLGLDIPLIAQLSSELGLAGCTTVDELAEAYKAWVPASLPAAQPSEQAQSTQLATQPQTTQPTSPILKASNLSYSYEHQAVIEDVSFEIAEGSFTALVGRTGSGKSTLARLVCALATPKSGTIAVNNIDTCNKKQRRELRSTIGYVMQRPERQLFATTVFEDIAYGPQNLGLSAQEVIDRVESQLHYLNLESKRDASPFELSGGQQRLVALAGVLAMQPKVLVLDEPMAGLDPQGSARLRSIIKDLNRHGTTILMITHSMDDVASLADTVLVLDEGRIALTGTPREVFAHKEELHRIGLGIPEPLSIAFELQDLGAISLKNTTPPLTATQLLEALICAKREEVQPC